MANHLTVYDIAAISATGGSFLAYYAWFWYRTYGKHETQLSRNFDNLEVWLDKHFDKPDAPSVTLAIQTLRNTILIAVFIGGASLQYSATTLETIRTPTHVTTSMLPSYSTPAPQSPVPTITSQQTTRALILAALLVASFLNWALVIRYASHVGYQVGALEYQAKAETASAVTTPTHAQTIGTGATSSGVEMLSVPQGMTGTTNHSANILINGVGNHDFVTLVECKRLLHRMAFHFAWGFRFIFFAIPFIFYVAGPTALIVSAVLMQLFMLYFDSAVYPAKASKRA